MRARQSLDGKTPAEACGITVEGKNKWKTLIQMQVYLLKEAKVTVVKNGMGKNGKGIVYHRIRQEQFAEEFLDNCIDKTRTIYGLTESQVKKLIADMGLCKDAEAV